MKPNTVGYEIESKTLPREGTDRKVKRPHGEHETPGTLYQRQLGACETVIASGMMVGALAPPAWPVSFVAVESGQG